MTSLAPKEAKWRATPRPMPLAAPVTMAIRSCRGRGLAEEVAMAAAAVVAEMESIDRGERVGWSMGVLPR